MASISELEETKRELERQMSDASSLIEAKKKEIADLVGQARNTVIPKAREELAQRLAEVQEQLRLLGKNEPAHAAWDAPLWATWQPDGEQDASMLRIGELRGTVMDIALRVPAYAPFVGGGSTLLIPDGAYEGPGLALLHSLLLRAAVVLPHKVRFVLLDPAHHGLSFPMSAQCPLLYGADTDIRQSLQEVERLIASRAKVLSSAQVDSFDRLDPDLFYEEQFIVLCAADFPNNYDRRAIETLQNIARSGPRVGVYPIIHLNTAIEVPHGIDVLAFEGVFGVAMAGKYTDLGLTLYSDTAIPKETQDAIWGTLASTKPAERIIPAEDILPVEKDWWQAESKNYIAAPFGIANDRTRQIEIMFGKNEANVVCSSAILAGWSGSGKSVTLHAIITSLASRYSPEELRLYLVDGKTGSEFQAYRDLPHAEVVSLRTSAEMARSVLAELVAEMGRRFAIFVDVGVQDIDHYRDRGYKMPRILMVVDEYQLFFEGDQRGEASNNVLLIAEKGRAPGVHLLMASQSFNTTGMDHRQEILNNVHARISLRLSQEDANSLTVFGREGRDLIQRITFPGQLVINAQGGADGGNVPGKAALVDKDRAAELSAALRKRAEETLGWQSKPVLFDGYQQPNLGQDTALARLAALPTWPTAAELEPVARKSAAEGGFGLPGWYANDRPYLAVLGRTFSVHGEAQIVFDRSMNQHAVLVGDEAPTMNGMWSGILASLALNAAPKETEICVVQGQNEPGELGTLLDQMIRPAGIKLLHTTGGERIVEVLDRLVAEVGRRTALSSREIRGLPSVFFMLVEGDRITELRQRTGRYGDVEPSPEGAKLIELLTNGSAVGIHVILSVAGVYGLRALIDPRHTLAFFRHRVALQMNEDDSHALLQSPIASRLQVEGQRPVVAVYRDMAMQTTVRFRPFTTDDHFSEEGPTWAQAVADLGDTLARRRWAHD